MGTETTSASVLDNLLTSKYMRIVGYICAGVGWLLLVVGCIFLLYLIDSLLPPLDRGVMRATLRGGIGAGVVGLIYQATRAVRARGRQLRAVTARAEMARDNRPPVLYFRSFRDDKISYFNLSPSFEEVLAAVFRDVGPVVAIGLPDEKLPPIGAARMHVADDRWRDVVMDLLKRAAVVIIRPGLTEGVLWEVKAAIEHVAPTRLLVAMPRAAGSKDEQTRREDLYVRFRAAANDTFPVALPGTIDDGAFITFDADWNPQVLRAGTIQAYQFQPRADARRALRPFLEGLGVAVRKRRWEVSPAVIAIGLIIALNQALSNAGPDWVPFEPPSERFVVALPGPAEETTQTLSSPFGDMEIHVARAIWKGTEYAISYLNYPDSLLQTQKPDEILDQGRDNELQVVKGTLLRETRIDLGGNPGRNLVIQTKGVLLKVRILLVGRQLIQITAMFRDSDEYPDKDSSDTETFFASLRLKP